MPSCLYWHQEWTKKKSKVMAEPDLVFIFDGFEILDTTANLYVVGI